MACGKKSLSENLKEKYSGKPKKSFKEKAKNFGTKVSKGYASFNKGMDAVEGFIYGKPQKNSSAKSRTSGRPPARKPAGMSEAEYDNWYESYYTWRSLSPAPKKRTAAKKKTTAKKRQTQPYPKVVYVPYPVYPSALPKQQTRKKTTKRKTTRR